MEVDSSNDAQDPLSVLRILAAGGDLEPEGSWPAVRGVLLAKLDENARQAFPVPNLPPPRSHTPPEHAASPIPSSPGTLKNDSLIDGQTGSQGGDQETAIQQQPETEPTVQQLGPDELPIQIENMLQTIKDHIMTFETHPPHTIQRLSELVVHPRQHYKALAAYLHAVDRVATVTSSTKLYPLPPVNQDVAMIGANGDEVQDPAASVSWANTASSAAAADEALGGALLTPIPWLRRSPVEDSQDSSSAGSGAQIHSESTETIDGPNGVGSIETVSVSINGISSTGHARGVTQGELLRQEQRAGVVPVSQLSRSHDTAARISAMEDEEEDDESHRGEPADNEREGEAAKEDDEEEETPHARGPEEIGAGDIGPQSVTTSFVGEGGMDSHDIDVEAAVGRRHEADESRDDDSDGSSVTLKADKEADTKKEDDTGKEEDEKDKEDAEVPDAAEDGSDEKASEAGTKRSPEPGAEVSESKKVKEDTEEKSGEDQEMD